MAISPFKIHVPDSKINRLKEKLTLSDFPEDVSTDSGTSWDQGPPVAEIKRLATLWHTTYDWRKVEAYLNTFPQYVAPIEVDGLGVYSIHHIHKRSTKANAIPLLFLHGWPGSFIEVTKMLDDLVQGAYDSPTFHVVAPSLIDFGFSSGSGQKSFNIEHHAEAYDKLMQQLGYNQYVVQGGDVGFLVARSIAKKYGPTRCKAHHSNTAGGAKPEPGINAGLDTPPAPTSFTKEDERNFKRAALFATEGFGYYKQQSTKPQTIGYSLRDSPIGLLAWIYEKLYCWADNYAWIDEEILTWVSIYYFSVPGPESPSKVYYAMEHSQPNAFAAAKVYIDVPLGISRFSNDLVLSPKSWNSSLGPIVFENEHEKGGHFAAWERPDAIVKDLRDMFGGPTKYIQMEE